MGGWRRGPNEISRYVNAGWLRRASSYERRRWNGPGTRYEREICRGSGSLDVCNAYAETGPLPRLVFLALSASYICSTPFDVLRLLFSPFNAILGYEGRLPRIRTRVALISGNGTFHDNGRALRLLEKVPVLVAIREVYSSILNFLIFVWSDAFYAFLVYRKFQSADEIYSSILNFSIVHCLDTFLVFFEKLDCLLRLLKFILQSWIFQFSIGWT